MTEEEKKEQLDQLDLTSDIFCGIVLEDVATCEDVIRILLGEKLKVTHVKSQVSIRQLQNRSVVVDILAEEESGKKIYFEMHPQSEDRFHRIRYNVACIDVQMLEKGEPFSKLQDVYAIYITISDFLKTKRGINRVVRTIEGTNKHVTNGIYEYYISLSQEGDTPEQTELLHYFLNSKGVLESKSFPNLVKRVRFLKEEKGGLDIMCKIMDKIREDGIEQGIEQDTRLVEYLLTTNRQEDIIRLFHDKLFYNEILVQSSLISSMS